MARSAARPAELPAMRPDGLTRTRLVSPSADGPDRSVSAEASGISAGGWINAAGSVGGERPAGARRFSAGHRCRRRQGGGRDRRSSRRWATGTSMASGAAPGRGDAAFTASAIGVKASARPRHFRARDRPATVNRRREPTVAASPVPGRWTHAGGADAPAIFRRRPHRWQTLPRAIRSAWPSSPRGAGLGRNAVVDRKLHNGFRRRQRRHDDLDRRGVAGQKQMGQKRQCHALAQRPVLPPSRVEQNGQSDGEHG